MGFEIDLYTKHEFTILYCYMNYLLTVTIQHIQAVREKTMVTQLAELDLTSDSQMHSTLDKMDAIMKFLQAMCTVSFQLSILLTRINPAFTIKNDVYVEERAYRHRFSFLLKHDIPAPLPYKEYQAIKTQLEQCEFPLLIRSCLESIETAKRIADRCKKWNPHMAQVRQVELGSDECEEDLCCESIDSHHYELEGRTTPCTTL
jgi:hypothetical protein